MSEEQKKIGDNKGKAEEKEMSFLDHLEELRWHLVRSIVAIFTIGIASFIARDFVFTNIILGHMKPDFWTYELFCSLSDRLCMQPPKLEFDTKVFAEQFLLSIKVSFLLGFAIAFPYIFWEIWRFIKPGLYKNEKSAARGIVFYCSLLFITGLLFGYYIIAPFAISFLGNFMVSSEIQIQSTSISSYTNYIFLFCIPTGIVFQLPIFVYFFSRIGLLTPQFMRTYRKHAIILILLLAAMITPPDVVTQFLIGIPLFFLYEISIYISKRTNKKYNADVQVDEDK